ncbi:response regulator transcription factor [Pontiellaceae bacterium B12219]|nr:response regulator transcription factor [Pontiellaceae bacterium B12219]
MPSTIKVMLVEDSKIYQKAIERAVQGDQEIELISQFGTAEFALRSLQQMSTRKEPDVLLLDLNLPGMSGLEALPFFQQALPDAKIIILTQSDKEADVLDAIKKGTDGYLLKKSTNKEIIKGIKTVMDGGATIDSNVARFILQTMKQTPRRTKTETEKLTKKEQEILTLVAEGLEQQEIATQLHISRNTVATHIRHIYNKLEVPNAPAAINKAYKLGLFQQNNR